MVSFRVAAVLPSLAWISGEYLRELDQVSPGIGKEREPTTDGRQLERLGDDRHAAAAELRDRLIDAGNVEAEVMEALKPQTVTQVLIGRLGNRAGLAIAEDFDKERIVRRRRDVSQVLIRIGPFVHDPEIELLYVPFLGGSEVRHPHGDVVALHGGERTVLVASRNVDDRHDGAPLLLQWCAAFSRRVAHLDRCGLGRESPK